MHIHHTTSITKFQCPACKIQSKIIAKMASMHLSSRFGVLRVDDAPDLDSDDEGKMMNSNLAKEKAAKAAAEAAKKKSKKKKKAQQQSNAKAELREMAFTKIASVPRALASSPPSSKPVVVHPEVLKISSPPAKDWGQWQEKDQGFIDNQYQHDIQKALLQSKLEFERREKFLYEVGPEAIEEEAPKAQQMNRKERRKHMQGKEKPQPMSLQEFHQDASKDIIRAAGDVGLDTIEIPEPQAPPEEPKEIFSSLKDEVSKALAKEKKKTRKKKESESEKPNHEIDGARQAQYKDELEKKGAEITQLNESVDKLKAELSQVKKRNKQLCFILGQGEMKDKASVLIQVEELISEKDELTAEVAELYTALEQEKSKVSSMKTELQKLQEKKK